MLRIDFGNAAFLQYERSHVICFRERPVEAVALGDSARGAALLRSGKATGSCSCWSQSSAFPWFCQRLCYFGNSLRSPLQLSL